MRAANVSSGYALKIVRKMHKDTILLAVLLIAESLLLTVADSRPTTITTDTPHVRRRISAHLGDISARERGILNEEYVPLRSCKEIKDSGATTSGLYTINLKDGNGEFTVFCDMTLLGGGWTVIQRRVDDTWDFERNWDEYVLGFGDFNKNFWLGLDKIKRVTDMGMHELYIGLENFYTTGQKTAWARYSSFCLGSVASNYPLLLGTFDTASSAGDSLTYHDGEAFSTKDKDNDSNSAQHCSQKYKGGWWYKNCHMSSLNGKWYTHTAPNTAAGIIWETWISDTYPLKTSVVAVRRA